MATTQQIRDTAAEMLGIVGEGETLPSYETADLDQAYLEVFAELQGLDLAAWSLVDDIPNRFAKPVSMLVAESRAVKYQVPQERYQRIKFESQEAMHRIRELQAPVKVAITRMEYF